MKRVIFSLKSHLTAVSNNLSMSTTLPGRVSAAPMTPLSLQSIQWLKSIGEALENATIILEIFWTHFS
jgi:hypothetical protein